MNRDDAYNRYIQWCEFISDNDLIEESKKLTDDEITERFSDFISFGTGGLRAFMGAGLNRINIYTVARATQGIANSLNYGAKVIIAYDNRIKSKDFAETAAKVFSANGCEVFVFDRIMPTPLLSFACREMNADLGVVITASHNPKEYNGYKVYNSDGCQICPEAARILEEYIASVSMYNDIKWNRQEVNFVPESVISSYYSKLSYPDLSNLRVAFTPLHGTGKETISEILGRTGLVLHCVNEQVEPNGDFPTCSIPNPEIPDTLKLGIELMESVNADLLLATDPDGDRVGVAVCDESGSRILSGNELGVLLFDFLCKTREIPKGAVVVKTYVTTNMVKTIAMRYGVSCIEVPVGFKYIGDYIGKLEQKGMLDRYFFGLEESCGYLPNTFVRDKDAIATSLLICEMAAWYKLRNMTLCDALNDLYAEYGYYLTALKNYEFYGDLGRQTIGRIMDLLRVNNIEGWLVEDFRDREDYSSDMLRYTHDMSSITIRPSGTEQKIKVYIATIEKDEASANERMNQLNDFLENHIRNSNKVV